MAFKEWNWFSVDSELKLWHLRSEIDLGGYKSNIELRSIAKDLKKLKIEGKRIKSRIDGFCGNSFDYKVKASNSELQLFDRILLFDEEEMHQGSIEGHNKGGTTQIDLKLEDSKIRICSNSD